MMSNPTNILPYPENVMLHLDKMITHLDNAMPISEIKMSYPVNIKPYSILPFYCYQYLHVCQ